MGKRARRKRNKAAKRSAMKEQSKESLEQSESAVKECVRIEPQVVEVVEEIAEGSERGWKTTTERSSGGTVPEMCTVGELKNEPTSPSKRGPLSGSVELDQSFDDE